MSIGRIFWGLWRNYAETSEKSADPKLRTHYYKVGKTKMIEQIKHVLERKLPGWNITHIDNERGEMLVEKKGMLRINQIVISVIQVEPFRSAVDVVSAYKGSLGDLGMSYFTIVKFFEALNKEIPPVK
ncbi:MAG TPA: hypothetical protein VIG80_11545 [Bacillaceae bacterium]